MAFDHDIQKAVVVDHTGLDPDVGSIKLALFTPDDEPIPLPAEDKSIPSPKLPLDALLLDFPNNVLRLPTEEEGENVATCYKQNGRLYLSGTLVVAIENLAGYTNMLARLKEEYRPDHYVIGPAMIATYTDSGLTAVYGQQISPTGPGIYTGRIILKTPSNTLAVGDIVQIAVDYAWDGVWPE